MFFNQKYIIYWDNGNVEFVDDLYSHIRPRFDDFYAQMKFSLKVDKPINNFYYFSPYRSFKTIGGAMHDNGFYLYNENLVMISPDLLYSEYTKISSNHVSEYMKRLRKRQHSTSHTTSFYKKMHTLPARRAACAVQKSEGEPEFRACRRKLPNPWDEYMSKKSCSWKNSTKRKKQYKGS